MKPSRLTLVVSDFHIGSGHQKGRPNFFDDFREDSRFEQLLEHYARKHPDQDLELVINGDFFDLLKVPLEGKFPEAITEGIALRKLQLCLKGHPRVIEALRKFVSGRRRCISYLPGNHDAELAFPRLREELTQALTGKPSHPRVRFIWDRPSYDLEGGVQIRHGHNFEALHATDYREPVLTRGQPEPILNLPWGSLFVLQVINRYKPVRPHIDQVKPFWPLWVGGLFFDTSFTLKLSAMVSYYFLRARISPLWRRRKPFRKLGQFLLREITLFPSFDRHAERLLRRNAHLNAVIMGHTHNEMVRRYTSGKLYVNTGTWVRMVNLDIGNLGTTDALHYALVQHYPKGKPGVSLMRWRGRQHITEEVLS